MEKWAVGKTGRFLAAAGTVALMLWTVPVPEAAGAPGAEKTDPGIAAARYGIEDGLNRLVIPAQTPSFVGGQVPPLAEVTPGNRFMHILYDHGALYLNPGTGLGLSAGQRTRIRNILEEARTDLIKTDSQDLRLVQLFEAALVSKVVPMAALNAINMRIGGVEGRESVRFLSALRDLQGVLNEAQISSLRSLDDTRLPAPDIAITPALAFADRILAIRWRAAMDILRAPRERTALAARASKARKWLWTLAAEKTVSDRDVNDLLGSPFVDMARLDQVEKTAGPLEGKFWETFMRIVSLLNPPAFR